RRPILAEPQLNRKIQTEKFYLMNRRAFLQTAMTTTFAMAVAPWSDCFAAETSTWPIGCFNRAWTGWSYDDALDGIAAAGYKLTGLLSSHRGEVFTSSAAKPDYLDALKKRINQRGLAVNMTAVHLRPEAQLSDNLTDLRQQIENAARLELKFML